MPSEDAGLGMLIQRSVLPASTGMDAMEARLIVVQEVPPKAEVRFYAVRGDYHEQLTSAAALAVLREHVPQKPVSELSDAELIIEVSTLRVEADRMRPVYAAAKAWRERRRLWSADVTADAALAGAVDAAVTAEKNDR